MGVAVVFAALCPHPPVVVPEVGGREALRVSATRDGLLAVGRRVKESEARTVVVISPHSPLFEEGIGVSFRPRVTGDLGNFGAPQVRLECTVDLELAEAVRHAAGELGVAVIEVDGGAVWRYGAGDRMDHGLLVPLYFLARAGADLPLLPVSMGLLAPERLYAFGVALQRAARNLGRAVAVLASGDLSHRLLPGAPAGYHPDGEVFDRAVVRLVEAMDVEGLLHMDPDLVERAGECGWRSLLMMLGALDGYRVRAEVLSYEGPFGVGYLAAAFTPLQEDPGRRLLERLGIRSREDVRARRAGESYLVRLARETLERYVRGLPLPDPGEIPEEFRFRAGVFVSLKKGGVLRGCMGTVAPQKASVVEEVMANAITAGIHDPRFAPVRPEELDELEYSVDVLSPPEPVRGLEDLDPRRYGVIVRSGRRSGLLLPGIEGIETAAQQVAIAREKAGIGPHEPVTLERFEVVRHK